MVDYPPGVTLGVGHTPRGTRMVVTSLENATTNETLHRAQTNGDHLGTGPPRLTGEGAVDRDGVPAHDEELPRADGHRNPNSDRRNSPTAPRRGSGRTKIASLNMRGYGSRNTHNPIAVGDKWMRLNQLLRDSKIAILALQETHLTTERIRAINDMFETTMHILGSLDSDNPTGARGVAFALNKRLLSTDNATLKEIIPGRAATLAIEWAGDRHIRILNIYAPNRLDESELFWNAVGEKLSAAPRPDIMMGDFNLVEESLDRIPAHPDKSSVVERLQNLIVSLNMTDGWRANNPRTRAFTYLQTATGSQSRIDRIYVNSSARQYAEDWAIEGSGLATDHRMVSCTLANYRAPKRGKGRWALPLLLLRDDTFTKVMKDLILELQKELRQAPERSESRNPQRLYKAFKEKLRDAARQRAKTLIPKIDRKISALEGDIKTALNAPEPDKHAAAILQDKLSKLEMKRFDWKRRAVGTKDWIQGETMSRYWIKLNAPQYTPSVINELRAGTDDTGRRDFVSASPLMANVAKAHYDSLQSDPGLDEGNHETAITEALRPVKKVLTPRQKGALAERIKAGEIEDAIDEAPPWKAPGLDGIPVEVWKTYLKWQRTEGDDETVAADKRVRLTEVLRCVFNDIERWGVDPTTQFTEGWICPIYKKKDRREIGNYRPITLLNSDYKVMTRVLAVRLAEVADSLVSRDQAAFIPGRQIFGHIKLAKSVIDLAEAEEINGAIIALDQEKAYDKINHRYLWAVLRQLNFPENFIRTVRHLYENATSCVFVNGSRSDFFKVIRGVRQGDPMSCLLFILAIEPLACALKDSDLAGLQIPRDTERLIAALFADDTTVYLSEEDNFESLMDVLHTWCEAARAAFNGEKTEILPIGSKTYRNSLHMGLSNSTLGRTLPTGARIVPDGDMVRMLGAWIGNDIDEDAPWTATLQTLSRALLNWGKRKPTIFGRKLIVGMEVGGRTQFLAKTQSMSKAVEDKIVKLIASFMWPDDRSPRVSMEVMCRPTAEGGLNLLDIRARNDAIDAVWLRDYLAPPEGRPRWALAVDAIFARRTTASYSGAEDAAKINTFIQKWSASERVLKRTSPGLARMLRTARKHNLHLRPLNLTEEARAEAPIWYHVGDTGNRSIANTLSAKCLRNNHAVVSVGDCAKVAARLRWRNHESNGKCDCYGCDRDRSANNCPNPHRCVATAEKLLSRLAQLWRPGAPRNTDALSLTPRRLRARTEHVLDEELTLDPSITNRRSLYEDFRMFGSEVADHSVATVVRRQHDPSPRPPPVDVYTDGSCEHNGASNARAAYGVWFGPDDQRNACGRVPGPTQSNQIAEIYAIEMAARLVDVRAPLRILSDSKFATNGLTHHLPTWEDLGWIAVKHADSFKRVVAIMRERQAPTILKWVKGHAGVLGNEGADGLARSAIGLPNVQHRPLEPRLTRYLQEGMRVSVITQSRAYRAVCSAKPPPERRSTRLAVGMAIATLASDFCVHVTEAHVWAKIRSKDISRKHREFLWRLAHATHRVGKYWNNIPNYEGRALCETCECEESMHHILTECAAPGQFVVWDMVRQTMRAKGHDLPRVTLGTVIGAPLISLRKANGKPDRGASRLAALLVVEAAHLIWKLRCERVIQPEDAPKKRHTIREIKARLWDATNRRMQIDKAVVRSTLPGWKPRRRTVRETWAGVLADCRESNRDWLSSAGVLVGRMGQTRMDGIG